MSTLLYRFLHFQKNSFNEITPYLELFLRRKLYFSDVQNFNDPLDPIPSFHKYLPQMIREKPGLDSAFNAALKGRLRYSVVSLPDKQVDQLSSQPLNHIALAEKFRMACSRRFRVLCMSENVNSNLMWSHYANNHRGFAVEFNVDANTISGLLENNFINEVVYKSGRYQHLFHERVTPLMLIRKSAEWAYEKEHRAIVDATSSKLRSDSNGSYVVLDENSISALYLGWHHPLAFSKGRKNEELKENVMALFSWNKRMTIYQMLPDSVSFDLMQHKIDDINA